MSCHLYLSVFIYKTQSFRFTDLPGNVCFPASPGLAEVLQDGSGFVLFDALRHHVQDVMHHCSTQLQVKVGLHTLLGNSLGDTLRVTSCNDKHKSDKAHVQF